MLREFQSKELSNTHRSIIQCLVPYMKKDTTLLHSRSCLDIQWQIVNARTSIFQDALFTFRRVNGINVCFVRFERKPSRPSANSQDGGNELDKDQDSLTFEKL